MSTSTELWGYFSAFIIFICGVLIAQRVARCFGVKQRYSVFLYLWHTIFCLIYLLYVIVNGGDVLTYYKLAISGKFEFRPGTNSVLMINSLFIYGLNFNLLGSFLVNNIFGFLGLISFQGALNVATENKTKYIKKLSIIIVLLPSISFWSSALGKDSLSFMATGFALWAALKLEKRAVLMAFAIFVMFLVRPHMAGMMIIALAFSLVLSTKVSLVRRLILGTTALLIAAALIPFALQYAGISDPSSAESVMEYMEGRQSLNMHGGGSVNIASMNLPMKLFTYMFRPLPIEANSIFSLLASLDNIILLFLFIAGMNAALRKPLPRHLVDHNRVFMWIYCFLAWGILAMTTANLGIAMRQKWMFAPMLIFLLISLIGKEKKIESVSAPTTRLPRGPRFK